MNHMFYTCSHQSNWTVGIYFIWECCNNKSTQ